MSGPNLSLAPDCTEAALEASCATLVALQLLGASADDDPHGTRQLTGHITSVRRAIAELRAARGETSNPLAFGFVMDRAAAGTVRTAEE